MTYNCVLEKEGECYNVSFPDVPGAISYGIGMKHALQMAHEALNAILELEIESGNTINEPKYFEGYPIQVKSNIALAIFLKKAQVSR